MYNENDKKRFIEEREKEVDTNIKAKLLNVFNKSELYESLIGKDLYNFSTYEIIDFYKSINVASLEYLGVINSHLKIYAQWANSQNLVSDCQNHFLELKDDVLASCLNNYKNDLSIINKKQIDELINRVANPRDAFCMLCLFEGMKGNNYSEILELKISDFDNDIISFGDKKVKPSIQLKRLANKAEEERKYYAVSKLENKPVNLIYSKYIVKDFPNAKSFDLFSKGRRLYKALIRNFEALGFSKIKPNDLYESGRIHMIKKLMQENNIGFEEFLYSDLYKEVEQTYGKIQSKPKYIIKYKKYFDLE